MSLSSIPGLPLIYNVFFLVLFLLWLNRAKIPFRERIYRINPSIFFVFCLTFFGLMIVLHLTVVSTDVDDSITSAARALSGIEDGTIYNPYIDKVVLHNKNNTWILSNYNYFPPDLLFHTIMYIIFAGLPFIGQSWLLIVNTILAGISYLILRTWAKEKDELYLGGEFLFLTSFFLLNNAMLMLFFFILGMGLLKASQQRVWGITSLILSASVKFMTGWVVVFLFLADLWNSPKLSRFLPYAFGSFILLIFMIPFGITEVIQATIIIQGDLKHRTPVAEASGPILIEFANFFNLTEYFSISLLFLFVLCVLGLQVKLRTPYERIMVMSFISAFTLPFYATELFVIPLALWMFHSISETSQEVLGEE